MAEAAANRALIIFIRNPVLGKVKTRLAADAGNEQALEIYGELLRHTRETTTTAACARYLFYSDFIAADDEWNNGLFKKNIQANGSLGEKMYHAFELVLKQHKEAVIIGCDCYTLTAAHIEAAFNQLMHHDVVIGPAEDGGYYLLGLKKTNRKLFENIEWSTEKVLTQTLAILEQTGMRVHLLEQLSDVDTLANWEQVKKH